LKLYGLCRIDERCDYSEVTMWVMCGDLRIGIGSFNFQK
jgi:hypothetical protein